jgi:hypothetical protein
MANKTTTPWGAADVVDEVKVSQKVAGKAFATVVQLLETSDGQTLVRIAYTTDGVARRGPVTLRQRDLEQLRAKVGEGSPLAAALGWGVLLTIALILVYQGGLALGAATLAGALSDAQLREMNAVGGLLILGVGLKLLAIRDVKVADYLPAILVAPVLVAIVIRVKEAVGL